MSEGNRMYDGAKTWNPFVGCCLNCCYCVKSYKAQLKRRKSCPECQSYVPHFHWNRLDSLPKSDLVFVCAFGDIAYCNYLWLENIWSVIKDHLEKDFLIQTKAPWILNKQFGTDILPIKLPGNVFFGTTVETDRIQWFRGPDEVIQYNYDISGADLPAKRTKDLFDFKETRQTNQVYVTIEPILDFYGPNLVSWLRDLRPAFVYVGYDNHHSTTWNGHRLPEPPLEKTLALIDELQKFTEVRRKSIRKAWYEEEASN